jgi:hypothetical protein
MRKPKQSRTRYRKPRRFVEDDIGPDDEEREDPINGPGENQEE